MYPHRYTPGAEGWMLVFACKWLSVCVCKCVCGFRYQTTLTQPIVYEPDKKIKFPLQQYCENNGFFVYDGKKVFDVRECCDFTIHIHLSSSSLSSSSLSVEWWMMYTEWDEMKLKNCVPPKRTRKKAIRLFDYYFVCWYWCYCGCCPIFLLFDSIKFVTLLFNEKFGSVGNYDIAKKKGINSKTQRQWGKLCALLLLVLLAMIIVIQLVLFHIVHKAGHCTFHFQFQYNDLQTFIHFGMTLLSFPHPLRLPLGRPVSL